MPKATHTGPLRIGDIEFECAVLDNGVRIVSETNFMSAMGMYRSGALSVRRHERDEGAQIPLSLAHKNLKPYADMHLGGVHYAPYRYRNLKGKIVDQGIRAELIPKICEVWIDADKAGVLGPRQKLTAKKADILLRGFARVGIVALVDEATGYQYVQSRLKQREQMTA